MTNKANKNANTLTSYLMFVITFKKRRRSARKHAIYANLLMEIGLNGVIGQVAMLRAEMEHACAIEHVITQSQKQVEIIARGMVWRQKRALKEIVQSMVTGQPGRLGPIVA